MGRMVMSCPVQREQQYKVDLVTGNKQGETPAINTAASAKPWCPLTKVVVDLRPCKGFADCRWRSEIIPHTITHINRPTLGTQTFKSHTARVDILTRACCSLNSILCFLRPAGFYNLSRVMVHYTCYVCGGLNLC